VRCANAVFKAAIVAGVIMRSFDKARQLRGEDKKSVAKVVRAIKKQTHQHDRRNWRSALRDVDSIEDDVRPVVPGNRKHGAWDIV